MKTRAKENIIDQIIGYLAEHLSNVARVVEASDGTDLIVLGKEASRRDFHLFEQHAAASKRPLTVVQSPARMAFEEVDSSNVHSYAWDQPRGVLYVRFGDGQGKTYLYTDVPEGTWSGLYHADSKGGYHHDRIKGEYTYAGVSFD